CFCELPAGEHSLTQIKTAAQVRHEPCGGGAGQGVVQKLRSILLPMASMMTTTAGYNLFRINNSTQLGDFDAKLFRAFDEMFPRECAGPLRGKLIEQRHGIVIVQQNEMVVDRQLQPGADDQSVFDGAGDGTHIHDAVWTDKIFSFDIGVHVFVLVSRRSTSADCFIFPAVIDRRWKSFPDARAGRTRVQPARPRWPDDQAKRTRRRAADSRSWGNRRKSKSSQRSLQSR